MKLFKLMVTSFLVDELENIVRYTAQGKNSCVKIQSEETVKALSDEILKLLRDEMGKRRLLCKGFRLDAVPGYGYVRGFARYSEAGKEYELSALAFCNKKIPVK